jgi:hypothetical protein
VFVCQIRTAVIGSVARTSPSSIANGPTADVAAGAAVVDQRRIDADLTERVIDIGAGNAGSPRTIV